MVRRDRPLDPVLHPAPGFDDELRIGSGRRMSRARRDAFAPSYTITYGRWWLAATRSSGTDTTVGYGAWKGQRVTTGSTLYISESRVDVRFPRLIAPKRFADQRGWFCETWNTRRLAEQDGITANFVQDNESWSTTRGTIRGLHLQTPPHAQGKLVRAVTGRIFDVAVDVRRGSPTYGRFVGAELSAQNGRQLWVPVGFAHGFCTLEDNVTVAYKVTDFYAPDCERGIRFDDPMIGIDWPISAGAACLSDKDTHYPSLAEFDSPFEYDGAPLVPLGA